MNKTVIIFLLVVQAITLPSYGKGAERFWDFNFCVPIEKIDLNPFRKIVDGKDLAYLMLLKSFISTDKNESGVFESYEFSPDGKVFTARLSKNLAWDDGSTVLPIEAGEVIVKTLPFRAIGERLKIDFKQNGPSGVKVIDSRTFQIKFETQIENVTGVWREALSTNSRHNRFWLYKQDSKGFGKVLAKHQIVVKADQVGFQIGNFKIALADKNQCNSADFTIFYDLIANRSSEYSIDKSSSPSAVTVQTNSERLNLERRKSLVSFVRFAFRNLPKELGFSEVGTFFMPGEPGFSGKLSWDESKSISRDRKYKIAYENPIFLKILEDAARVKKVDITFVPFPFKDNDVDAQLLASGIQEGRHVILQDVSGWPHVLDFLRNTPKTQMSLSNIAKKSASTIPPDNKTLRSFEKIAEQEQSLAPVARKYPIAYSKINAPLCLKWTVRGELNFYLKAQCGH